MEDTKFKPLIVPKRMLPTPSFLNDVTKAMLVSGKKNNENF